MLIEKVIDPEDFAAANNFMSRISDYIGPLLTLSRQKRPQVLGTALLVEAKGAFYVVSAAHVLNNFESIFFYTNGSQSRKISGALQLTHLRGEVAATDRFDVGVARIIGGPMPPYDDWGALPIGALSRQSLPRPLEQYCFVGFPSSRGKANPSTNTIKVAPTGLIRMPTAFSEYGQMGLSEASHLLFRVDRKAVMHEGGPWEFPVLNGISGAPIWCADEVGARIVGIAIEYHAEQKLLVATDIGIVLDMIEAIGEESEKILAANPTAFD